MESRMIMIGLLPVIYNKMKEFIKIVAICLVMSILVLLLISWIFNGYYFNQKAEAAFVAPLNITVGCKGKEKVRDYLELRNELLADVVNGVKTNPCMKKALLKILSDEQKIQPMITTNFNRKQIIKSVSVEIQRRNK